MPYRDLKKLPEEVRNSLDPDGWRLYAGSYNMAWERYRNLSGYGGGKSRDELAREFAWSEIERLYERDERTGAFKRKSTGP